MDDLEVRSALNTYVLEAEPPIGLTGEAVLAAGRRSRRRRLTTAVAGAALAVVAAIGATYAIATPVPVSDVVGSTCKPKSAVETPEQTKLRLSCVVSAAVRSRIAPGKRIERLTIPGEIPPADPFLLIADPIEDQGSGRFIYHMGVRVSDEHGAGSVYVKLLPFPGTMAYDCKDESTPKPEKCSAHQYPRGLLTEVTYRNDKGLVLHAATLTTPKYILIVAANNSGVLTKGDGLNDPVDSPAPPVTEAEVRDMALTDGLTP
ncbi:hypothetical protein [Amycolatopsis speibonae]|uniref:Uncharacterized protein n=1 Tax=Amycolatopsis speibonae TaxID=1450224 RepID=A0ABV7NMB6_9PSEU